MVGEFAWIFRTPYVQEKVDIGSGPPGSKIRWFRSKSNESRFINTFTFDAKEGSPTLVMVHGYGASQGFFFRNFDALAQRFRVIAIDQLGWAFSCVEFTLLLWAYGLSFYVFDSRFGSKEFLSLMERERCIVL